VEYIFEKYIKEVEITFPSNFVFVFHGESLEKIFNFLRKYSPSECDIRKI